MPQLTIHSNVPVVRKGLERLRGGFPQIGRLRLYNAAKEIQRRMKKAGKKIKYPVNWHSLKQMLAFFASDGFGRGIPTVRTNRYINGWQVQRASAGYTVLHNKTKGARYIGGLADGSGQSKIHKGRWPLFRDVADLVISKLPKLVVKNLREFVPRAFK
jgi:hypothetical protein